MCPVEMTLFSTEKECPVNFGPPALHSDYFMASVPLSDPKYDADPSVMDIFFCLTPDACALVFVSLIIFWGLFKYFANVDNIWFKLYSCALGQDSFKTHRSAHKWLTILFVLAVFWFMQYFTSFISTDMTVASPAEVIDTLSDLAHAYRKRKPQVTPVILEGFEH